MALLIQIHSAHQQTGRPFAKLASPHTARAGRARGWAWIAYAAVLAPLALPAGALAQSPVVQPVPPRQASELNEALRRLASNPRDLDALIDAGNASLGLDDVDAATGFFGRANELSPNNPRVKLGLAAAFVRSGKPLDAFRLLDEAQSAGGASGMLAADRGLAFDLVGAPRRAQEEYARALAFDRDNEIIRRLAISHAIVGDRRQFEATLRPLVDARDFAAYRARAFGLAILGQADEALAITEAVMPRDLATRLAPYLRYMSRLTAAQQAAAANLGIFPSAAQIGRDDPQFAQYRESSRDWAVRTADARLTPSGPPMGSSSGSAAAPAREDSRSQRRSSNTAERRTRQAQARASRRASSDPLTRARSTRVAVASPAPTQQPTPVQTRAPLPAQAAAEPVPIAVQPQPVPQQPVQSQPTASVASVARPVVQELPASGSATSSVAEAPVQMAPSELVQSPPVPSPSVQSAPAQAAAPVADTIAPEAAEPRPTISLAQPALAATSSPAATSSAPGSFDLAEVPPSTAAARSSTPAPFSPTPSVPAEIANVAAAFEGFTIPPQNGAERAADVVDITAIEPPREAEPEPAATPSPPANPSRIWVQIATGRDRSALKFDWRRFSRKAPAVLGDGRGPFVVEWGQANRLLAGPFASQSEARTAMNTLTEAGIDNFTYTSPKGQEIEALE